MHKRVSILIFFSAIVLLSSLLGCMSPQYQHLKKGDNYSDKGKWNEAIVEYTKAIEIAPDLIKAYNNRAVAYTEKGDYDKAIIDCNKVIQMDPQSTIPYYNRSIAFLYKKEYQKALEDCDIILMLGLNSPWIYYHKAMAYIGLATETGDNNYYKDAHASLILARQISENAEFNKMIDQKINSIIDKAYPPK